jgi:predicted transcriptional regulator
MSEHSIDPQILAFTAQIVSAHVSNNSIQPNSLPALIRSVFTALSQVGVVAEPVEKLEPAVPIKRSVFPDYIVCLEDGKKLKMLKRHLANSFQMTPEQYRARWGLPSDYPMVAPNYSERRSAMAKGIGLGRSRAGRGAAVAAVAVDPTVTAPTGKPGRKPKVKAAA